MPSCVSLSTATARPASIPGSVYNTYNADVTKLQAVHNYYVDDTTTITSRLYGFHHRRDRYQNFDGEDPPDG